MSINWQNQCLNKDKIKLQNKMIEKDCWQTCLNCEHWNKNVEKCKLYEQKPPLNTIVVGCEQWYYEIPF